MRKYIKILFVLLFSYPVYILIDNILKNTVNLLAGYQPFLYTYGFICSVGDNLENILYYSGLLFLKAALFLSVPLFKIHHSKNVLLRRFCDLLILLFSFEFLYVIAHTIDLQLGTFYRHYFYASSAPYGLSLALNLPALTVPVLFLIIAFFAVYPILRIKKTKELVLFFTLSFLSVLGYALIFENFLIKS